ncbi:hypothetical protein LTS18_002095 [Coniosporium uncinatum]|uniref:Uncharacterized protein n=1 Tax=Coniosporium uncinatum TaxID=93489 RepID=A0ACC3DBP3_9PEZI|nr:hypothetical protein LTS18_002095 [Coniosporium uncinatum]
MSPHDCIFWTAAPSLSETAKPAFALPHNTHRYSPPSLNRGISSRESTPFPDAQEQNEAVNSYHRLQVTFDQPPKNGQEYVFGTDPRVCDVLLGKRRGEGSISGTHFCITFDAQRRVTLRDFSRCGTAVSYDGQGKGQKRSHFTWIIFHGFEEIEVELSGTKFVFRIILAEHEECESDYLTHVDAFLAKRRTAEESGPALPPFDMLDIYSQNTTAAPTAPRSPNQGRIYILLEELGRGEFGAVNKVVDVSNGHMYAGKEFFRPGWEAEVAAMKRVSHVCFLLRLCVCSVDSLQERIVQFVDFRAKPTPLLVMEYLPLGNLQDQHNNAPFAFEEAVELLYEGLQGIDYLHSQGIAHRDIKPANILVVSRRPLSIKFTDFGLVGDLSAMKTFCGTALYAAPEIWKGSSYTSKVDIWPIGVVVLEVAYGLPKLGRGPFRARDWCKRVVQAVEDRPSDGLVDCLSTHMLQIDPEERSSAGECLGEAYEVYCSYRGLRYLRYHEAECTTPTEEASTFRLESYRLRTTGRDHLPQLVPSNESRSPYDDRSRKRQKLDLLSGADRQQTVFTERTLVETSLEEAALGLFPSVREPILTGAPSHG